MNNTEETPYDGALTMQGGEDAVNRWLSVRNGFRAMNNDEFGLAWRERMAKESQPIYNVNDESNTAASVYRMEVPDDAPDGVRVGAYATNKNGTVDEKTWRSMCYSGMSAIATDEQLKELSEAQMKDYMVKSFNSPTVARQLFPDVTDDNERSMRMQSYLNTIAENVCRTKNEDALTKIVDRSSGGVEGLGEYVKSISNAALAKGYQGADDDFAKAHTDYWWGGGALLDDKAIKESYLKNIDLFNAMTGREGDKALKPEDWDNGVMKEYREWWFNGDGGSGKSMHDMAVRAYTDGVRAYLHQVGVEAYADYVRNGGEDWYEGMAVAKQAVDKAQAEARVRGDMWAHWRADRESSKTFTARKYRAEFDSKYGEKMKELNAADFDLKMAAMDKKEAEAREAERKKVFDDMEKSQRKEQYKAEYAAQHVSFAKKGTYNVRFAKDGNAEPVVTVPPEMYAKILKDTGAKEKQGVYVYFGTSKTPYLVKSGDVKGIRMNGAAIRKRYGKHQDKATLHKNVNTHPEEMIFKAL